MTRCLRRDGDDRLQKVGGTGTSGTTSPNSRSRLGTGSALLVRREHDVVVAAAAPGHVFVAVGRGRPRRCWRPSTCPTRRCRLPRPCPRRCCRRRTRCPTRRCRSRRRRSRCPTRCCRRRGRRAPHDVVAAERTCPRRRCRRRGAPHDVVAARTCPTRRCRREDIVPHTTLSPVDVQRLRRAPDDVVAHAFARRLDDAARQPVVAPDESGGSRPTAPASGRRPRVRVELRQAHGAERVEEAGALPQRAVAGIRLRGVLQDRLDQVRRQVRIRLQHQRDRAADDRRRHAGAAQASDTACEPSRSVPVSRNAALVDVEACCPAPPARRCRCPARPGPASRRSR